MRPVYVLLALTACSTGSKDAAEALDLTLPDDDGDLIMDHHEGVETDTWFDFDADGTPNWQDLDSDGDGILDLVEAGDRDLITFPVDSDNDGLADFVDLDADGNCLDDTAEGSGDLDTDLTLDFTDRDDDGDLILDYVEIGAGCAFTDSDGDGEPDYHDPDSDGDGIGDVYEGGTSSFNDEPTDSDADGVPDYLDVDSDGDGLLDAEERGDGGVDEAPRDSDGDGLGDYADADSDNDGLLDDEEGQLGTDPLAEDTDGDGFTDGAEVAVGVDPLDAEVGIDGIYVEVPARTDVNELFTFELSIEQGDVTFLLDTTGSMGGTVTTMSAEFGQIVDQLATTIPDAQYGVATFDDYVYAGMGSGADRPFILRQQVTSDLVQVQSILSGIPIHGGGDWEESSGEAIYQALSGAGYDQNCNGDYDGNVDISPFIASAGDPFGGTTAARSSFWAGGGPVGGMGFRDHALPIVVYATDAPMRVSDSYATPGGCPGDASSADITTAAARIGAKLIGIHVNGNAAESQMRSIASLTDSYYDDDGDGVATDPLVFDWSGGNAAFRSTIVDAINQLIGSTTFDEVVLEVEGDDQGFVVDIDPAIHVPSGAVDGEVLEFTLTFRGADAPSDQDELHRLTLNVIGDGIVLLDTLDIYVVVPGTAL